MYNKYGRVKAISKTLRVKTQRLVRKRLPSHDAVRYAYA